MKFNRNGEFNVEKWFKRLKNQKGMTLVELLAVVVILGIVAAIAVPAVGKIIENSKEDAHVANGLLIINAAKLAVISNEFPLNPTGDTIIPVYTTAGGTTESPTNNNDDLVDKGFLDGMPKDPDSDNTTYISGNVTYNASTKKYSINLVGTKRTLTATEAQLNSKGYSLVPK